MATDTLTMAVWECTVPGCTVTETQYEGAHAVTHIPRGVNRAPHLMRRRCLPDPHHEGPGRTTVLSTTPDESGQP